MSPWWIETFWVIFYRDKTKERKRQWFLLSRNVRWTTSRLSKSRLIEHSPGTHSKSGRLLIGQTRFIGCGYSYSCQCCPLVILAASHLSWLITMSFANCISCFTFYVWCQHTVRLIFDVAAITDFRAGRKMQSHTNNTLLGLLTGAIPCNP